MSSIVSDKVITVDDFFSPDECDTYVSIIDGNRRDPNRKFASGTTFYNDVIKDARLAWDLYGRATRWLVGVTSAAPYITMARFVQGEDFGIHTDTGTIDPRRREETKYTMLIYLNEGYTGGKTLFYNNDFTLAATVTPKKGMAVIFDIDTLHSAEKVETGAKYWIGCDLMGKISPERSERIDGLKELLAVTGATVSDSEPY